MSGAIPPLPQYALMAWCSFTKKSQGQIYLYFLPPLYSVHPLTQRFLDRSTN
jgi:hypothetical protein